MKRSVITLSVVVLHEEREDPIQVVERSIMSDLAEDNRVVEIIEPHVDSTEEVTE